MEEPNLGEEKSKKQPRERRILIGVLSALVVVIVGLVIAVVVIVNNNRAEEEKNAQVLYESEIGEKISALEPGDIEGGIRVYQDYIDRAVNPENQAVLYTMRSIWITDVDRRDEYKSQAIEDILAADFLLESAESAVNVINVAYSYDDEELADEYQKILSERQELDGVTVDEAMETEG